MPQGTQGCSTPWRQFHDKNGVDLRAYIGIGWDSARPTLGAASKRFLYQLSCPRDNCTFDRFILLPGAAAKTETIEEQAGAAPQAGEGPGSASGGELSAAGAAPPKPAAWGLPGNGALPAYAQGSAPNGTGAGGPPSDQSNPGAAPSTPDARKVVVLGVPWQTEDATLHAHFSQFGVIEEAQIMRERYTGKSRGFGFVTFASMADAQRAIAADHVVDGRRCEAKAALPEGKVGSARTTRIFVARIPSSVNDPQFRAYFEQFGPVQDAYMPKDPSKQGHRGIGFVTYATTDSVERVMSGTHVLNGNEVAIDRATPKERAAPGAAQLPGRLSMSQPNLHLLSGGGSAHGGTAAFAFMRGGLGHGPGGPHHLDAVGHGGGAGGLGTRHMSHPVLSSVVGQFGSPPTGDRPLPGGYPSGANLHAQALAQAQAQAQVQAQAAALRHHLSSSSLSSMDGSAAPTPEQQQQLINLISQVQGQGAGTPGAPALHHSGSAGRFPGSAASSSSDLTALIQDGATTAAQQQQLVSAAAAAAAAAAGWPGPRGPAPGPPPSMTPPGPGGGVPPSLGPASARAGPRIFVGKLNRDTTDTDVKEYFSRFGFVLDVYLPRDKANKREHRGFGFVTFETEASIQRVVSHGPHHIRGSMVAIDAAVPRQEEMVGLTMDPAAAAAAAAAAAHHHHHHHPAVAVQSSPVPVPQRGPSAETLQAFESLSLGEGGGGASGASGSGP